MTQHRRTGATPRATSPVVHSATDAAAELARLHNALDCTLAGLWDWYTSTQRLALDPRTRTLVGLPDSDSSGHSSLAALELLLHPQDLDVWRSAWQDALAGNSDRLDCEVRFARGPAAWNWLQWRGRVLSRDAHGQADTLAGVVMDIQPLKQAQSQLGVMAQRDPLTDLPNRALLADRLSHALASARRNRSAFVVMEVLLEGVAPINEALGIEMGNHVIRQAARRMATCTRASDSVARTGNDEFVLLLENVEGTEDALAVAEKLRHHINEPLVVDGHWLQVSASIGLAMYPAHGDDLSNLQAHAAQARLLASRSGGDRVAVFTPSSESSRPTPTAE